MPNRSLLRTRFLKKGPFWRQWLLAKPSIKSHHSNWRQSSGNRRWRRTEGVSSSEGSIRHHLRVSCCPAAEVLINLWFDYLKKLLELIFRSLWPTYITPIFYRYLQTLSTISTEKNSTIVFPIPIEMFSKFIKQDWSFVLGVWKLYLLHFYIIYTLHELIYCKQLFFLTFE